VFDLYNDLFTIGGVTVHGYGLMIGIGVICAVLLAQYRAPKRDLSVDFLYTLALSVLIFGFIGAKLLFVIVEFKAVLADPMLILSGNGFVIYGAILGGVAAMFVACRIKRASFLNYLDLIAPSVALAQGFGRIGCFLAGCCYGRETDSACGIVFKNSLYAPNGVRLIPTQLIMSAGDFLIALILLLYARRDRKKGRVGGLYLMLYSVGRFAVEFLRGDYRGNVGFLSTSQFIAVLTLILGVLLFFTNVFARQKEEGSDKNADDEGGNPGDSSHDESGNPSVSSDDEKPAAGNEEDANDGANDDNSDGAAAP
jgi:phosphatidylglycerol:prolipoprotein diacylglycerol transferase